MMSPKGRSEAAILAEIRRLRQILEKRRTARLKAELTEAQHEIETLRLQLRLLRSQTSDEPPASG